MVLEFLSYSDSDSGFSFRNKYMERAQGDQWLYMNIFIFSLFHSFSSFSSVFVCLFVFWFFVCFPICRCFMNNSSLFFSNPKILDFTQPFVADVGHQMYPKLEGLLGICVTSTCWNRFYDQLFHSTRHHFKE